jgi:uncharacterized protein YerC
MAVSKRLRYEVLRRDNHASPPVLPPWEPNASRYRINRPLRIEPVRRVNECWRPVVGYEGLYEVSDHGAVRSVYRTIVDSRGVSRVFRSRLLRPSHEGNPGYAVVSLYRDRVHKYVRVHTLVAAAFIGSRPAETEVAHKDGDRSHNCLRNLRYATRSANQLDRVEHGTSNRGVRHPSVVLAEPDVLEIARRLAAGHHQRTIAERFGIARTTVSAIATGRAWGHLTGLGGQAVIT